MITKSLPHEPTWKRRSLSRRLMAERPHSKETRSIPHTVSGRGTYGNGWPLLSRFGKSLSERGALTATVLPTAISIRSRPISSGPS